MTGTTIANKQYWIDSKSDHLSKMVHAAKSANAFEESGFIEDARESYFIAAYHAKKLLKMALGHYLGKETEEIAEYRKLAGEYTERIEYLLPKCAARMLITE